MANKWEDAAKILGDGLVQILTENNVPPLPENVPRIHNGAKQFVAKLREAAKEEFGR